MASTYLTRSVSTTGNRRTWTFSAWVKKANTTQQYQNMFAAGSNNIRINFSNQNIWVYDYNGSGFDFYLVTNRLFRDTNAFYHIVVAVDTTQATSSDRVKLWVNGVQETSFSTETYPSQNHDTEANTSGQNNVIGTDAGSLGSNSFDGVMTHIHWVDGTAYDPSTFGETDATTGIWKPKTAPSVTYGTNGFFLKFASAGSLGTDSSGNGNNFTLSGSGTQTQDTPSNVFATWNSLAGFALPNGGFSNGNTTATQGGNTSWTGAISNLGVNSGKYYCEVKWTGQYATFGFLTSSEINRLSEIGQAGKTSYGLYYSGDLFVCENGSISSVSSYGSAISSGSIVQLAIDKDNNKLYWGINGTWQNSANPSSGTGGRSIAYLTDEFWHFAVDQRKDSGNGTMEANFGNGYFGTTAVSSAQSPSDGIGLFEYSVPSGYKALCTKSINSQEYS